MDLHEQSSIVEGFDLAEPGQDAAKVWKRVPYNCWLCSFQQLSDIQIVFHFCYLDRGTKSHHKATFCQRQFMFLMHFSRLCPFVSNLLTQPEETLRFEIDKAFLAWDAARLRQSDALWIWKPCSSGAK